MSVLKELLGEVEEVCRENLPFFEEFFRTVLLLTRLELICVRIN